MALATNTTTGEIKLAGDLAGSNDGNAPELTNTAVTPGEYTVAKITVDTKGRITNAINSTSAEITGLISAATPTTTGLVQIGQNLYITGTASSGSQLITFSPVISAGTDSTGLTTDTCATYSIDISVDDATAQTIEFPGSTHQTIQDILDTLNGISGLLAVLDTGNIRITSDSTGTTSNISLTNDSIFSCVTNFSAIGTSVRGADACELYAKDATAAIAGVVQIGDNISVTNGIISIDTTTLIASTTEIGQVIVPTSGNLDIDVLGNISVPDATDTIKGVLSVNTGNGLTITSGVLDFDNTDLPVASTATLGQVIVPTSGNLDVDGSGNISVLIASDTVLGVVQIGNGLVIDGAGIVTAAAALIATDTTLGTVIVPTSGNLDVDVLGNISVPVASDTVLGVVQIADVNNISVSNGVIDVGTTIAKLDVSNSWTKSQNVQINTISGSSITPNLSNSNTFTITLTTATTLQSPTNQVAGGTYVFIITQDGGGSNILSFGAAYKFREGVIPAVSTDPGVFDIMSCVSDGSNMFCSYNRGFQ